MRRIVIRKPGGYAALELIEEPDPIPGTGQILIAVRAAGVNYADTIVRMGLYASAKKLHGYPITPGFEVSGTVAAVGPGTHTWHVGDSVLALTLFEGYSSHLLVDADRVFACPTDLTHEQCAALPTVFLTAWFMAHQQVYPRRGDAWLVHSAAGGVGSALAQLGQLAGCRVVGVVGGAHKRATALAAGCAEVIDKSTEQLWSRAQALAPNGYDAIFDANGVSTLSGSYAHLAPTGKLLIYGFASMLPKTGGRPNWVKLAWDWLRTPRFNPLQMTQENRSVLACNLSFLSTHTERLTEGMDWLLERFEFAELLPPAITTFPLAQVAEAHKAIESGQTVGKLVLIP